MFLENHPMPYPYSPNHLTMGFNVPETDPTRRQHLFIHMARIAQGRNREELAQAIGVTDETIRLWEIGDRTIRECFRDDLFESLAVALNQPVTLFTKPESLSPRFNVAQLEPHKRQGRILCMARIGQGMSRVELGEKVNLCREALRQREIGKISISAVELPLLAKALNQDPFLFWS